jgi:hypothetical protein
MQHLLGAFLRARAVSRLGGQDGKGAWAVCRTLFGLTDGLGERNSKNATAPRCS